MIHPVSKLASYQKGVGLLRLSFDQAAPLDGLVATEKNLNTEERRKGR